MPHYNIVIETSSTDDFRYRADVAKGPTWTKTVPSFDAERSTAYADLMLYLRFRFPAHTFDFMHVEAT